jgi:hypothetical protein
MPLTIAMRPRANIDAKQVRASSCLCTAVTLAKKSISSPTPASVARTSKLRAILASEDSRQQRRAIVASVANKRAPPPIAAITILKFVFAKCLCGFLNLDSSMKPPMGCTYVRDRQSGRNWYNVFSCVDGSSSSSTCNPASNCSQTGSRCLSRNADGSCANEEVTYSCQSSTSFDNCNAPSNCRQSGTTCLERRNGSCVREQVNYTCESSSSFDNCNAPGNCSQTGTTCLERRNGACIRERVSYSCESSSSFNECQPQSNCTQQGSTCVERHNGRCIRERVTYSCESRRNWDNCSPSGNCEAVSTTCVRYQNGQCVERQHEYRCPSYSPVDTCTVPSGCQRTGNRCVDTYNGSCIRYEQSYICPGDPAGCVGRAEDYRCENPAGPPPIDVIDEVGQPSWREQGCPQLDPELGCEVEGVYCVEGPETRIIDGVEVYDDCWREETRYVCPGSERRSQTAIQIPAVAWSMKRALMTSAAQNSFNMSA